MKIDLLTMFQVIRNRLAGTADVEMRITNLEMVRFDYWINDIRAMSRCLSLLCLERNVGKIEDQAEAEADLVLKALHDLGVA